MLKTRPAKRTYNQVCNYTKNRNSQVVEDYSHWVVDTLRKYECEGDVAWFVTLTSQFEMTPHSARKFFNRWMRKIVMDGNSFWSMFVMEHFEMRDGCHIHAMVSTTSTKERMKEHWRNIIGCTEIEGKKALARTWFEQVKIPNQSSRYCCKYMMKERGDYDITERHRTPLQKVRYGTKTQTT